MFSSLALFAGLAASVHAQSSFPEGVIATGTQGVTNPPVPTMGTAINQTSYARLLSLNSIDDFCLFAPPTVANISDTETEEVAWCTKPRNNARVIPDGTFTGLNFIKTDFYVQIMGYGDLTKLNIPAGDWGGELDPHGATGSGNPVGGNVTVNIGGTDQPIAEWMLFIDYNQFCIRACTNANSTYSSAFMCWHELDEMGCTYNMPGNYNFNGTFETCDADVNYPPGWYPTATSAGTTLFSTFAQYYAGVYTGGDGLPTSYTVGTTVTPSSAYFTPSSSNCVTTSSISNGIALASLGYTAGVAGATAAAGAGNGAANGAAASGGSAKVSGGAKATSTGAAAAASGSSAAIRGTRVGFGGELVGAAAVSFISGIAAIALLH